MKVGDRVRHSGYVTQQARDYWNQQGDYTRKQRAKDALDKIIAERGTITEVLHNGYEVRWDGGGVSRCLSFRVIAAPAEEAGSDGPTAAQANEILGKDHY